ncbi:MAG: nucleotide sugar dehydrogenase [Candidatus Hydrogenedentes bacterium]|nr:nucleotide sugar dehydrogenase [Candidatus Hydrogenedentota bacterium]
MRIVVVGGGRMGLPLASLFADNGATVTVCDVNSVLVDTINRGLSPYEEPDLDHYIARNVKASRLAATTNTTAAVHNANVVVVIVPAWLTEARDIDYSVLRAASRDIGRGLQPRTLVSYETTVAVGGTRSELVPVLEQESGLKAGVDFFVSFSPERVKANLVLSRLQQTPKIVGGYNTASTQKAVDLYKTYLGAPVTDVISLEAAELAKLAGMLYRDVNIALANELAALSEIVGVDFALVRDAANTDGESRLLLPGIGVGGHCTPVYPHFMINDAIRRGVPQRLSTAARAINDEQPARCVERLERQWKPVNGRAVHILGLGFRPDVKVDTYSTAYPLRDALLARGAVVTLEDPFYSDDDVRAAGFVPAHTGRDRMDAIVLNTAHTAFKEPNFSDWRAHGIEALIDGRNFWNADAVSGAGILYLGIGRDAALSPPNTL